MTPTTRLGTSPFVPQDSGNYLNSETVPPSGGFAALVNSDGAATTTAAAAAHAASATTAAITATTAHREYIGALRRAIDPGTANYQAACKVCGLRRGRFATEASAGPASL